MRARCLLPVIAASTLLLPLPADAGDAVAFTDVAGDANGSATVKDLESSSPANQAYADVVSVRWEPVTARKDGRSVVTGFRVVATFSARPKPPSGVEVVYRASARVDAADSGQHLGPVFYTTPLRDGSVPQTALFDTLTPVDRYTTLPAAKISGTTITWTVPFSALPPEVKPGDVLHALQFESRLSEDLRGAVVPQAPASRSRHGLATGVLDDTSTRRSYVLG